MFGSAFAARGTEGAFVDDFGEAHALFGSGDAVLGLRGGREGGKEGGRGSMGFRAGRRRVM